MKSGGNRSRIVTPVVLAVVVAAMALAVASPAARHSSPKRKLHLTAVTRKVADHGRSHSEQIVLVLKNRQTTVGRVSFPGCAGTSDSVVCGGTVKLRGVGSHLTTLVTFNCPLVPPFTCGNGKGFLDNKAGKRVGTIILKINPNKIKKGKRFPVTVILKK